MAKYCRILYTTMRSDERCGVCPMLFDVVEGLCPPDQNAPSGVKLGAGMDGIIEVGKPRTPPRKKDKPGATKKKVKPKPGDIPF